MAKASLNTLDILSNTIRRLESAPDYQWGHMGSCNCGFLAQQVTGFTRQEIHRRAMMSHGDWTEQLNDYCPSSGVPMSEVITMLVDAGFDIADLQHLERLSDPEVLKAISSSRSLRFNHRPDVLAYFNAWKTLLEDELLTSIELPVLLTLEKKSEPEIEQGTLHGMSQLTHDGREIERRKPHASTKS